MNGPASLSSHLSLSGPLLRLILLIACAHAMVHVYELSLPSVEQNIAREFYENDPIAGKQLAGMMSTCWRLMWGFGALVAGWIVDRYGGRLMLAVYLLGCGTLCASILRLYSITDITIVMLLMGGFASIYHPAGLALISHETDRNTLPRALGLHGILGSLGIGATPLAVVLVSQFSGNWRTWYAIVAAPSFLLAAIFLWQARNHSKNKGQHSPVNKYDDDTEAAWREFWMLVLVAILQGFIYSAIMSFLPRYLSTTFQLEANTLVASTPANDTAPQITTGNMLASIVLLTGCVGQYLAGWFARPKKLEQQLTLILFGNAPFLLCMALAESWFRPVAAGLFALVHFMQQPIANSLIAKYTPPERRSLCYGISFGLSLGLGSFGAWFAGCPLNDQTIYGTLALISILAGIGGLVLLRLSHPQNNNG
jgi:FSR family fosmidomycin resistance protein-like MFS transporter